MHAEGFEKWAGQICGGGGEGDGVKIMQHIFIIGAKGLSFYGGYEQFLYKILQYHKDNEEIQYHIACKANGDGHTDIKKLEGASEVKDKRFHYCNADCFLISVPQRVGAAQAVFYDLAALKECCRYIKENQLKKAIVYILACRIGPWMGKYAKKIHSLGGRIFLNPDGHEWMRAKWPFPIKRYWKISEKLMVKQSDLIVCDSKNIEQYICRKYKKYNPKTTFIAYGAETSPSTLADDNPQYTAWMESHGLVSNMFYTMIGRCVPENNFETVIREFMHSGSERNLAIITTNNEQFLEKLDKKLHYSQDKRIKFVGTVYDQELLKKIRENAYGYFHGHSVGGTNPSLLEALGSTRLNLLFDVGFNREVAEDAALYWTKKEGMLSELINKADSFSNENVKHYGILAKKRILDHYSWDCIADLYSDLFCQKT